MCFVVQDKIERNRRGVIRNGARGGQRVHERKCRVDEGAVTHASKVKEKREDTLLN